MQKKIIIILILLTMVIKNNYCKSITRHYKQTDSVISIKSLGALGDGVNDDGLAIMKALNNPAVRCIYFPSGKYALKTNIVINKRIRLFAKGTAILSGSGTLYFTYKADGSNVSDLTFNGINCAGICNNLTFVNDVFSNIKGNAIQIKPDINKDIYNLKIDSCIFENIYPYTDQLYNSSGRAIYITSLTQKCFNVQIVNNKCKKIYGGSCLFLGGDLINFYIRNNTIDSISGQGIELFKIDDKSSGEIGFNTISNCGVLRISKKSGVGCNGIYASTINPSVPMYNIKIIHNTITNVYENGCEGNFGLIQDNMITNTGYDLINHPTPSPEGIFSGMKIIHNTIINPGGHGINIFSNNGVSLNDKDIEYNTITQTKLKQGFSGISINTRDQNQFTQNVKILNNKISNFDKAISLPYGKNISGVEVQNNHFENCNLFIMNTKGDMRILDNVINNRAQ